MSRFSIIVLLAVWPGVLLAQTRQPEEFRVSLASSPIAVDGRLEEPAWQQAVPISVKYEFFPGDNTPSAVETLCFVTYDRDKLYVGCRAADPDISELRANLADRDEPRNDDTVGFMIDTFNDGRRAFQFRVNARGVQMDAFNSDVDDSEDWSWDAIWDAKVQVGNGGYTAEIAVPFSSLRFPRVSGVQTWGFMAIRDRPRSTRYRMRSSYVDRNRTCLVCQFDKLTGFSAITPGRNLEFDPTVTAAHTATRDAFPGGPLVAGPVDKRAGLSARWSITPNVVFSGTANPDFYQVEADSAQLNVNDRFQLFFPERRPFFLEGSDFFATPLQAVFTRTVADPDFGLKLTGKEGPHAFGVFAAQDSITGIVLPGFEGSSFTGLQQRHVTSVMRYRRDVGNSGSTLGVLYAGREGDSYANRVGGVDGLARISRADSVRFQWIGSHTEYPGAVAAEFDQPARPFTGQAFSASYNHGTRNWRWRGFVEGVSPAFRADAGFIPQIETRFYQAGIDRIFVGSADRWFNEVTVSPSCDRTTDWQGGRASWGCDFPIDYRGPLQLGLFYNAAPNSEYYRGETYNNFRHQFGADIRPSGAFSLYINATVGGAVDFANARKAEQVRMFWGGSYDVFGRVKGSVDFTLQTIDVAGGRLLSAHLTQGQVVYHLNLRTFVRAILQYTDITRDPALYLFPTTPTTHRLFSQYLFSYKLNPQTVLLMGYSDNASGTQSIDLTRTDRTFFMKIGYAWVR
jgi:Carbohydrate family 9 binding domain-like/Domain of unknown function (DUF5916)